MYCEETDPYEEENIITKFKRRYYPSNIPDTFIRDGITGDRYDCKVGSKESLKYFRYIDATGTCNNEGRPHSIKEKEISRDPNYSYFVCPEECMKHLKINFDNIIIQKWYNIRKRLFPDGYNIDIDEYEKFKQENQY
jgi:hypothetical protein